MEGEGREFQDWEVLHSSDETGSVNSYDAVENMGGLEGIDDDSEGMIRADYFSLDSQIKYVKSAVEGDSSEAGSVESENPSWIDPGSDTRYPRKGPGEFWPDTWGDKSDGCKSIEFDANHELGFAEAEKSLVGFEGIGEIGVEGGDLRKFWFDSGGIFPISMELGELDHGTGTGMNVNANSSEGSELLGGENDGIGKAGGDVASSVKESVAIGAVKPRGEESERKSIVWWKVPFEFLKYCVSRVSPVWTFSVVAAAMGFFILGRKLYMMKRKSRSLQPKVTIDDKKVSQFMGRAARLNEAFSLVKRVPVIRPALPAAGVTPWPVMSLR